MELGLDLPHGKLVNSQLISFLRVLHIVYNWLKLTVLLWTTFIIHCSCIRSQFPFTVDLKGTFLGANEHFPT